MQIEVTADQMNSVTVPGLMAVPDPIVADRANAAEPEAEPKDKKAVLADLTAKINEGMADAEAHTSENLEKHRAVGKALFEAKAFMKSEKFKPVGGWKGWTTGMGWNTRWCDYLIRLHVEWDAVQDAIEWKRADGVAIDGVCGALQALNDHKRENETDEEAEQRAEKEAARTAGKGTKRARQIAAARFIRDVLAGKKPSLDDVQIAEFVKETLEDQPEEAVTEKDASQSAPKRTRKPKAPQVTS